MVLSADRDQMQSCYTNTSIRPYLKWAGGKRQLISVLRGHLPCDIGSLRYYEPFVGAGALFFGLQPRCAAISDSNKDLMLTYTAVRDDVDGLVEALLAHKSRHCEEYFYHVRELDRNRDSFSSLPGTLKAARLIYLNKTCYNGLYRVNSQGTFNVPYGRYANPAICDEPVLRAISAYLNHGACEIAITNVDFADAVGGAGDCAFIYFDPPYHSPGSANFTGYQADGFGEREQKRLRDVMAERTDAGVKCMLSNADTRYVRDLYDDGRFTIIPVKAKRAINSNGAGRGDVDEVLIMNWDE